MLFEQQRPAGRPVFRIESVTTCIFNDLRFHPAGLENRRSLRVTVGSNPTPTAYLHAWITD